MPPAPLIVFSHGNSFPAGTYSMVFASLRQRGFDVAALDAYGHDPAYPVSDGWPHLVRHLHDFTRVESARRASPHAAVWLVGHSLGGYLSLMAALQHPTLACGVVLVDAPVLTGWRAGLIRLSKRTRLIGRVSPGATSRRRRTQWPDRDAALEHFRGKRAFAQWHPQCLADYIDHGTRDDERGRRVLRFDRDIETAIYNALPHHFDALLRRHPLRVPVHFIGGTRSLEVRQVGMSATQRVTQGRVRMVDGTHLVPMEKPDEVAAGIAAAIESSTPAPVRESRDTSAPPPERSTR
jgi:pimeloyl-ACP methyl ester carboxylesterase